MAYKSLFAKKYLVFHEKAASIEWTKIDKRLQYVILTLMRISGLGFLVIALLMLVFPIVNYFIQDEFVRFSIPFLAFIFCSGLFIINYSLYKFTKSMTPWKGSLFAMIAIIAGVILSVLQ
jgi:uncharacterized membrane protein YvlD (DUF360 family)